MERTRPTPPVKPTTMAAMTGPTSKTWVVVVPETATTPDRSCLGLVERQPETITRRCPWCRPHEI